MTIQVMRYKTDEGVRTALVKDGGYKYLQVMMMYGGTLSVEKVPNDEFRYMDAWKTGQLRAMHLTIFRSYGRRYGMTQAAKSFLREAAAQR
jgi:hypothetical protein